MLELEQATGGHIIPSSKTFDRWNIYLLPQRLRLFYQLPALICALFFTSHGDVRSAAFSGIFLALLLPGVLFLVFPAVTLHGKWKCPYHLREWFKGIPVLYWEALPLRGGGYIRKQQLGVRRLLVEAIKAITVSCQWRKTALYWRRQEQNSSRGPSSWAYALLVCSIADYFGDGRDPSWFSKGFRNWIVRFCSPLWGSYGVLLIGYYCSPVDSEQLALLSIAWLLFVVYFLHYETARLRAWAFLPHDMRTPDVTALLPWVDHDDKIVMALYNRAAKFGVSAFCAILFASYVGLLQVRN